MVVHSTALLLLLVLASNELRASDCGENDTSSVIGISNCFYCNNCSELVGFYYDATVEAHVNFTDYYDHFLNLSQLNFSQLLDHYEMMLTISHRLAVETSENEKNLTLQLSSVANATLQADELLNMLNTSLLSAMNDSHTARVTHSSSMATLRRLDMLLNAISDIVSRNITVLSHRAEYIYNQILTKLKILEVVADNATNTSRQQESLVMTIKLVAEEARNISAMGLATLCQAIDIHNATSNLIRQLNSQVAINIMTLQQQISLLVTHMQQATTVDDVFNTSQQLIYRAGNISIPPYDVELAQSMVNSVVQNVTELFDNFNNSLDQLQVLEEQAGELNSTTEKLLQTGGQLKKEAEMLSMRLNESFFRTMETINLAQSHFDNITKLYTNLTAIYQLFNSSYTDVVMRLEDAENITEVADDSAVDGEKDLKDIQQLLETTAQSLNNSTKQLTADEKILSIAKNRTEENIDIIESQSARITKFEGLRSERATVLNLNESNTEQLLQLTGINFTIIEIQDGLDSIEKRLVQVRKDLERVMKTLQGLELTDTGIKLAEMKVTNATETVKQNERLLNIVMDKIKELGVSSSELEEKYKQLKQHRDLLRKILHNVGEIPCGK